MKLKQRQQLAVECAAMLLSHADRFRCGGSPENTLVVLRSAIDLLVRALYVHEFGGGDAELQPPSMLAHLHNQKRLTSGEYHAIREAAICTGEYRDGRDVRAASIATKEFRKLVQNRIKAAKATEVEPTTSQLLRAKFSFRIETHSDFANFFLEAQRRADHVGGWIRFISLDDYRVDVLTSMNIDDLTGILRSCPDSYVMLETLSPSSQYTGERNRSAFTKRDVPY